MNAIQATGINPAVRYPSTETWFTALEAQIRNNSCPEEGYVVKREGETSREAERGRNRVCLDLTNQAAIGRHKKPS